MENKSTKQRLDELYDLLKSEYITENEFRSARSNILRESGFDLSPAPRLRPRGKDTEVTHEERRALQQPERSGCGCGCFLVTLLLIAALAVGVIFAVPEWPDRFGGEYVRTAKEEITKLWTSFFPPETPTVTPDPVPRDVPRPAVESAEPAATTLPAPAPTIPDKTASEDPVVAPAPEQPSAQPATKPDARPAVTPASPDATVSLATPDNAVLPSPSLNLPALPDNTLSEGPASHEEPEITVVEIPNTSPDAEAAVVAPETESRALQTQGTITANSARIRSTPDASIRTNVVGWGRAGDRFAVLEEGTDKDGAKWYRVRYADGKKEGWISASLVKLEK